MGQSRRWGSLGGRNEEARASQLETLLAQSWQAKDLILSNGDELLPPLLPCSGPPGVPEKFPEGQQLYSTPQAPPLLTWASLGWSIVVWIDFVSLGICISLPGLWVWLK